MSKAASSSSQNLFLLFLMYQFVRQSMKSAPALHASLMQKASREAWMEERVEEREERMKRSSSVNFSPSTTFFAL